MFFCFIVILFLYILFMRSVCIIFVPMKWYVLKSPSLSLDVRGELEKRGMQYFLPTQEKLQKVGGVTRRIEKPIVLNFLFIYDEWERIADFLRKELRFRLAFVYKSRSVTTGRAEPLVVPDEEMRMFARCVGQYKDSSVPYISPKEIGLEEGDLVRIVGGAFDGVEGVLLSQKGKDGGRVLVSVSNLLAVPTLHIEPEYLQILRYGKSGKHFYKHLDSYIPRLERCMRGEGDVSPVQVFVRRYCSLRLETLNAEAKMAALLLASYRVLGEEERAREQEAKLQELQPRIKSETTREFIARFV